MRRIADAESDAAVEDMTLTAKARARVRRFIFSANRTMWFSACELGIYLATGSSCVKTEANIKVFSGKGMAMMHECKRTVNHSTAAEGLLMAHSKRQKNTSMDAFLVPMDTEPEATQRRKRKQRADEEEPADEEGEADNKEPEERQTENNDSESERVGTEEDEDDDILPAAMTGHEAAGSIASIKETKQMFTKSLSHRDDWLHRGLRLQDMDYYHYSRHIERVELPRTGNAHNFQRTHGSYFLFEAHYPLAKNFVQVLRRKPKMVQNVGPVCRRSDVNGGEDNAVYKAYFHSCAHCEGPDQCANPLMYRHLLYPQIDDIDRYLSQLKANPTLQRIHARFEPAWKTRRWELEMLADRGYAKQEAGKRIGVIHDTTSFKEIKIPRAKAEAQRTDEHCFELRMQQILIQQLVRAQQYRNRNCGGCVEQVMEMIMQWAGVPCPWHAEQPHLAEWQAASTREVLMSLDSCVDARNLAQKQAAKHKSKLATEAEDEWDNNGKAKIVIEDLGGAPADLDEEELPAEATRNKYELPLQKSNIERILSRQKERVRTAVGRPKEMHKEMQKVAAVFAPELDAIMAPFRVASPRNKMIGPNLKEALQHQACTAESNRLYQEDTAQEDAKPAPEMEAEARVLSTDAEALLRNVPEGTAEKGPIAFALELAKAATLNADQLAPVALIAHEMQKAWEAQGKPARMKPIGCLMRMLLLGGGGCGKSRIINLVLTPLFVQYWGPRGCVKAAPSNKAARGILGKTMHVAAKLTGGSLNIMNLRCNMATQRALAHLWNPCGAFIIDEGPQGAAALYHALAMRSAFGRSRLHGLDMADYAEPTQTFGAVPFVIECGDELQLPPVPASAGLFADVAGAATEHLAGVEIFKQKDYVYRLRTMKRFHDETLVSILQKMRKSGGSKLTREEKKALRDTDVSNKPAEEQRRRLMNTELWYQAAPTWATVSMAQVIRSRLSAVKAAATLYVIPAKDFVLNRPQNARLTDEYLAECISSAPNMNNTGRLPSIALVHIGMIVRLTNTVESPEAVTDSVGEIVGIDVAVDEPRSATSENSAIRILEKMPVVTVKLYEVDTEYLPPIACEAHARTGAIRECPHCDFRAGCVAVEAQPSRRSFPVEVQDPVTESTYTIQVQRVQLPMTIRTASTINTLQGTTAEPGMIFHWKFPRFFSTELRWLATYVALSRPPSLNQLISIDLPDDIEELIQGGPPEGILSRFDDMFREKELDTHEKAIALMRRLGWDMEA